MVACTANSSKNTADDVNPRVPLKGSVRVPLRGSFKGSIRCYGLGLMISILHYP